MISIVRIGEGRRPRARALLGKDSLAQSPTAFDLVLLVDVLHHTPARARPALLEDMHSLTAEGGHYAVKDWLRSRTLAHLAACVSDRFVTGGRVGYFEEDELRALVAGLFPADPGVLSTRVAPRQNSLLLVYRRT